MYRDPIPAPNFTKIDVEGRERHVLRGASETIAKHRPVLICDYNDLDTMPAMRERWNLLVIA